MRGAAALRRGCLKRGMTHYISAILDRIQAMLEYWQSPLLNNGSLLPSIRILEDSCFERLPRMLESFDYQMSRRNSVWRLCGNYLRTILLK
jgi:hypothetical protein